MENQNKCGHKICTCPVTGSDKYCSEMCREAELEGLTEIVCDCDHANCTSKI